MVVSKRFGKLCRHLYYRIVRIYGVTHKGGLFLEEVYWWCVGVVSLSVVTMLWW